MAEHITIELKAKVDEFKRDVKSALESGSAQVRQFESALKSSTSSVNSLRSALGGLKTAFAAIGGAFVLKQIAEAAVQSAISIDKTRQTIAALVGGVDAANKKIAELRKLTSSPGVTTSLATDLFAQFKALKTVADTTINDLIKSIGRLNAVFAIPDVKTFSRNVVQIFQQGFERSDIKEALTQVPIFEQLLQSAFGTSDGQKLKKLKDAGKLTMDTFLAGLIEQINARFPNVQDSLATQFEKLRDRLNFALEPLGKALTDSLIPIFDDLIKSVEKYGLSAAEVFRDNRGEIVQTAREVGALVVQIGKLAGAIFDLGINGKTGLAGLKQEFRDALSIVAFMTDIAEGNIITRPRTLEVEAAHRRERFAGGNIRGPLTRSEISARIQRESQGAGGTDNKGGTGGGTGGGGDGTGARSRRKRFVNDFGLSDATLLEKEAELARIKLSNQAVAERRELERLRAERPGQLAGFAASNAERIRKIELETLRLEESTRRRAAEELLRTGRRGLTLSGRRIDEAVSRGRLTGAEAELLGQGANREFANVLRQVLADKEKLNDVSQESLDILRDEIDLYDRLGTSISDTERFMRGFNSQIESSGDIWDRFGQNVARAFGNVRDLFNGLKSAVLGFFNDLVGQSLQNIVRSVLGPIFSGGGGGAGGVGGFFRQAFGGGGLEAPPSVSGGVAGSISGIARSIPGLGPIFGASGGGIFGGGGGSAAGGVRSGFSFGGLGDSLLSAAPLLGLTIGGALGGQSRAGNILGAAGGLLTSAFISTTLGAPGALGSLAPALFSNPITAIAGVGLLVGSVLLGRASQRRKDEEASGEFLRQALQGIDQLAAGVASGRITTLAEARAIFDRDVLGVFRQQISGLKTKSVRDSRLTNQVRDLENVYQARIPPLIAEQERKAADAARFAAIDRRLIPEFATGGIVPGINRGFDSVNARLTPGEIVLNQRQQQAVRAMAGPNVFDRAGVPGINMSGRFATGGVAPSGGRNDEPIVIEELTVAIDAESIAVRGISGPKGRAVIVKSINMARLNREL